MVRHHLAMAPASDDEGNELACFSADVHELPLPNGCLDAVILHHALETAEDPRTAIREIARVLAPGGRLVVCGFNPLSLWGVRGAYARVVTGLTPMFFCPLTKQQVEFEDLISNVAEHVSSAVS